MATMEKGAASLAGSALTGVAGEVAVEFGREICGSLEIAEQREWLVTNGIGGYASGTISGNLTRRYHGLLVAALQPPVRRTQLVAKLEETASYDDTDYALSANRWASGAIEPKGFVNIESFRLEGTTPVWRFALGDALLEKRVWMRQGENTTYVEYSLLRGSSAVRLRLKALVNYRDFHSSTHAGDWQMQITPVERGIRITAFDRAAPFYVLSSEVSFEPKHEWYRDYFLPQERYRGLDDREDHLLAATSSFELVSGQTASVVLSTESKAALNGRISRAQQIERDEKLIAEWSAHDPRPASVAPPWVRQLILAADQFIVKRTLPEEPEGRSIIAGYPWFGDWGRDTMIALPGLTLTTGRPDVSKKILRAFARYVDGGMLPNNFPDAGGQPGYNTVDAALWFFEAARQYIDATNDTATLLQLYPAFAQMISGHLNGTRYRIQVDPNDGLLYAGENGVQLTWMDAKVGDWVVTPRIGKPIEVNALWYNALNTMARFATVMGKSAQPFLKMAAVVRKSFAKFWNASSGYCYDVIDSPGIGNDASLRPNQIFAVSLPESPFLVEQQRAIVDICARRLLTSYGLRSLDAGEPAYRGHYGGGPTERDGAYHQGTVWGWLLGPFVLAHLRVHADRKAGRELLEPLGKQICSDGLGTLSEIFDGDAPFVARGCIAQAWTVAEVLRAWRATIG